MHGGQRRRRKKGSKGNFQFLVSGSDVEGGSALLGRGGKEGGEEGGSVQWSREGE